jgi:prepilin-type N-terminal cleavage/methylation domain-containing protein
VKRAGSGTDTPDDTHSRCRDDIHSRCRDGGFTIVEVLVAISLLGIVMTALTSFFVNTLSVTNAQSGKQAAAKVAADAAERVRALKGSAVTAGRDKTSSDNQWASPAAGVAPYLTDTVEAYDPGASYPAGATASLPTTAVPVVVDGVSYGQNWYVGTCWQADSGGDCTATADASYAMYYRVIVAITYPEKHCAGATCAYVVVSLVNAASTDPVFNSNDTASAPTVDNPGARTSETTGPVSTQLTATGGAPTLIWSATGLPTGLTISSAGLIAGTPTATGTFNVTATVTDAFGLVGSAAFTWTVNPGPALTSPGAQTAQGGTADSVATTRTGGTAPFTWSVTAPGAWGATGLPPGLAVNTATGVISGTPTHAGTGTITVTVVDSYSATASVTFGYTVSALAVPNPGTKNVEQNDPNTAIQISPTGGIPPYAYAATNLPAGLSIDPAAGQITGTPTTLGNRTATVTVTDADTPPATKTVSFVIAVLQGPTVTGPVSRSDALNTTISGFSATASGGSGPYTWSASGLPPGIAMTSQGVFSGKPTQTSRYIVTLTVTDGNGLTDVDYVPWAVTSASGYRVTAPTTDRSTSNNGNITFTATTAGGSGTNTWTTTGLPPGMSCTSAGACSGKAIVSGVYLVTMTAKDYFLGSTTVFMFVWTVT